MAEPSFSPSIPRSLPHRTACAVLLLLLILVVPGNPLQAQRRYWSAHEISYPKEAFSKLDTFEANRLNKADNLFLEENFKGAGAEYEAFAVEFPDSQAVAYALLRRGRCLQLLHKRFEAMKVYQEVLDYFPNDVTAAGAALYYFALSHQENGDMPKALRAWQLMADDPGYSRHPLAAGALNGLAAHLAANEDPAAAAKYLRQAALTFRDSNPDAVKESISRLLTYHVLTQPDEPALRQLYTELGTFNDQRRPVTQPVEENGDYWAVLRERIHRLGQFPESDAKKASAYHSYWAKAMEGRRAADDEFQIDRITFQFRADGRRDDWAKRLDERFNATQKEGDWDRIVRWMRVYAGQGEKVDEYYRKLDPGKMTNDQLRNAILVALRDLRNGKLAEILFTKLRPGEWADERKDAMVEEIVRTEMRDLTFNERALVKDLCMTYKDRDRGLARFLGFCAARRLYEEGLVVAKQLENSPTYAQEAIWRTGEFLMGLKKYREAIAPFTVSERRPDSLYQIAECHVRLGEPDAAIAQLVEVENFFKDRAPEAALKIAFIQRDAGRKSQFVAQLRSVLKKYPKSGQSSQAHQELEKLGVRIGGGMDAES
jgi:TolA-binding protein